MRKRPPSRIRSLDGLRGFFSLFVFTGHIFTKLEGGLVGVSLFFVLSGYLITALLLKEWDKTGDISLSRFYTRRMLRLYPALLAMVLAAFVLSEADHIEHAVLDAVAALLYVTNFWCQFDPPNHTSLVMNTWSLGVEEQFYLLWPIVLIIALRRRWSLIRVLTIAALGSFALTGALSHAHLPILQWMPFAQGPELAGGALMAVLQMRTNLFSSPVFRRAVGWPVALGAIALVFVIAFHGMHRWWMFGGVTFLAWPLIAHVAVVPDGWLSRLLSFRPAVWLGERSYAFYLIQLPVLIPLSRSVHGWATQILIGLPVTLVLSELSWVCVEQPFLRMKTRFETPGVAMVAVAASTPAPASDEPHPGGRAVAEPGTGAPAGSPGWLTRLG